MKQLNSFAPCRTRTGSVVLRSYTFSTFGAIVSILLLSGLAHGQTRAVGAGSLIIDDGSGHTITIQTPAGGWTGNIPFVIPIPPVGSPASGFTYAGTATNQILTWVLPNTTGPAPNNYPGGVQAPGSRLRAWYSDSSPGLGPRTRSRSGPARPRRAIRS